MESTSFSGTWFPVGLSDDVRPGPHAARVLGRRLVLFRDGQDRVRALEDRCPHRSVSLSLGSAQGGHLRCAYHGWQFDGLGQCVHVPSAAEGDPRPRAKVPCFEALERDGVTWARLGAGEEPEPPPWPQSGAAGYRFADFVLEVACPLEWVLQNFVDCAHTGTLHRGLFRGPATAQVRAHVERLSRAVKVETFGESRGRSLASRLLTWGPGALRHTDEYRAPHTVEVNYWWGEKHLLTTSVCTPLDADTTRIHTRLGVRFGRLLNRPVLAALVPLTWRILQQDQRILEDQARQLRRYPQAALASTPADLPCLWLSEAHRDAALERPGEQKSRDVTYTL